MVFMNSSLEIRGVVLEMMTSLTHAMVLPDARFQFWEKKSTK